VGGLPNLIPFFQGVIQAINTNTQDSSSQRYLWKVTPPSFQIGHLKRGGAWWRFGFHSRRWSRMASIGIQRGVTLLVDSESGSSEQALASEMLLLDYLTFHSGGLNVIVVWVQKIRIVSTNDQTFPCLSKPLSTLYLLWIWLLLTLIPVCWQICPTSPSLTYLYPVWMLFPSVHCGYRLCFQ